MRRKDREMGGDFGLAVIDKARYGIASLIDEGGAPYGIPLSIVRIENYLYFHSAADGKKVKIFEGKPLVSVAFVGETRIPENFSKAELDEMVKDGTKAVSLISSVFTTEYESAIVEGKVVSVEEKAEKVKAMRAICQKYTPEKMEYFEAAIKAGLGRANVYKIEIGEITAKRKRYDAKGEEMKWGRME